MLVQNKNIRTSIRIFLGGVAATIVWNLAILIFFGPAQYFLANPDFQSQKFIDVFLNIEPLPRMFTEPVKFYIGFLFVGIAFSFAYKLLEESLLGTTFKKGVKFGFIAWLLAILWFEFYMPWNVMNEPLVLVILELFIWVIVQMSVGITIAYTHKYLMLKSSD